MGKTTKLTKEQFILRAHEVHGWKYDYSKVEYHNSHEKVCIICPEHGEFWQMPSAHMLGQGCQKCYGNHKHTNDEFIKQAKHIHGDKYDYSKVEYCGNKKPVCIICKEHGEFYQTPNSHLRGEGCRICSYKTTPRHQRKTFDDFVKNAIEVHGDTYDYSKVEYTNNKEPICIICHEKDKYGKEHGEFWQRPDNHLHGQRCPKCANKMSRLEKRVYDYCTKNKINFEYQKKFKWLKNQRLDFYLPDYDTAIECQGIQHFKPIDFSGKGEKWAEKEFDRTKKYDDLKKKTCSKNNVDIIYYTLKNIKEKYESDCITDLRQLITILNKKKNG